MRSPSCATMHARGYVGQRARRTPDNHISALKKRVQSMSGMSKKILRAIDADIVEEEVCDMRAPAPPGQRRPAEGRRVRWRSSRSSAPVGYDRPQSQPRPDDSQRLFAR